MEEFQEADVLWPENSDHRDRDNDDDGGMTRVICPKVVIGTTTPDPIIPKVSAPELSAPIRVPRRKRRSRSWTFDGNDYDGHDVGCTDDAKRTMNGSAATLPPHVLVERRRRFGGRTAAYSMCAGKGRTLKGRDLRDVRNLVLRMTGFIEE